MKFVTNSISTSSKVKTLSELFKSAQTQAALNKTASAANPTTKTAGEPFGGKKAPPFGPGGKPQKKEEVDDDEVDGEVEADEDVKEASKLDNFKGKGPRNGRDGKPVNFKNMKKHEEEDLDTDHHQAAAKQPVKKAEADEAKSSGQTDAKRNPGNDPKVEGGKKGGGSSKAGKGEGKSDEAESSGQLEVEPLHQEGESTQQKPGKLDTMKENAEKVEAKSKASWKKTAELTPKEKTFLRGVWSMYWPKEFIDSILDAQ